MLAVSSAMTVASFVCDRRMGDCKDWLEGCDPEIKRISGSVCGPLMKILAEECEHQDTGSVEMFRKGALIADA